MKKQKIIEELANFKAVLECYFKTEQDCDNCTIRKTCVDFCDTNYMHTIDILEQAIELLREDEKSDD